MPPRIGGKEKTRIQLKPRAYWRPGEITVCYGIDESEKHKNRQQLFDALNAPPLSRQIENFFRRILHK